jgi:hypothetical protein
MKATSRARILSLPFLAIPPVRVVIVRVVRPIVRAMTARRKRIGGPERTPERNHISGGPVNLRLVAAVAAVCSTIAQADITQLRAATPPDTEFRHGPTISEWTHQGNGIAYLFAGNVVLDSPDAAPFTVAAVGAQLNAFSLAGSNQVVFGTATEAWAMPGSQSVLTGLEATAINMEPVNAAQKVSLFSTYKTRPDTEYATVPDDPSNLNAQAVRIESQPGTGFERGVVLAKYSLHASRNEPRPILLDLREVPPDQVAGWDLIALPDGCRLRYAGHGEFTTAC